MKQSYEYVYGLHSVRSILIQKADEAYTLHVQQGITNPKVLEIAQLAKNQGISIESTNKTQLDRLTDQGNHQGLVMRVKTMTLPGEDALFNFLSELKKVPFLLLLDEIQDPHNLGACLRTAAAAQVDAVVIPRLHTVGLTPIVRKIASGAAEILPIFAVTNLARCMRDLQKQGIWLIGGAGAAKKSIYDTDLTGPLGLVMGNEGTGLRRLTEEHCDILASIPMSDTVAGLNVSVATGVFLFEARRQRNLIKSDL